MRGRVSAVANHAEPVAIGAVMRSLCTGRVVASRHSGCQVGDVVTGWPGWQSYACVRPQAIQRNLLPSGLPISASLGVLGLNGLTAGFGLLDIGRPKAGQTVVVSTAAGAVGSCVGQIAKIKGCRSVGIAGGRNKTKLCTEVFGQDVAIDYKADDRDQALSAACPDGVDIYFDNTAGTISDAVFRHLAVGARVIVCGTASIASGNPAPQGPRVERHLLVKRASMQGLLGMDHEARYADAIEELSQGVCADRLRYREDILDGIAQAPGARRHCRAVPRREPRQAACPARRGGHLRRLGSPGRRICQGTTSETGPRSPLASAGAPGRVLLWHGGRLAQRVQRQQGFDMPHEVLEVGG